MAATSLIESPCPDPLAVSARATLLAGDPNLGPLADNGGTTETRALLAGSPALAAQNVGAICRTRDQRGVARTVPCGLGAYEAP